MRLSSLHPPSTATVTVHGKPVTVTWTAEAERQLGLRRGPLYLELELYFSCLVKKFVHFHDTAPARATVPVTDKFHLHFRAVTSTACSMELADRLGRQPETELDNPVVRRMAPRQVNLDFVRGKWLAAFAM